MRFKNQGKFLALCVLFFISANIPYFLLMAQKEKPNDKFNATFCHLDNLITVREGGRLGNCVWEYAAVLTLHDALAYYPYVPQKILDCLGAVFKNLRIPAYEDTLLSERCSLIHGGDIRKCESRTKPQNSSKWDLLCHTLKRGDSITPAMAQKPITELRKLKDTGQLPSILILPKWIALTRAFARFGISKFRHEMQIRDDLQKLAEKTLDGVKKKFGNSSLTFVGVHVRRTDYSSFLKKYFGKNVAFSDLDYYKSAMQRMQDLYNDSRMVFVVVSDDFRWCKDNLVDEEEGVFWGGLEHSAFIPDWKRKMSLSVGHDLAVLAKQNHSIIGYGTFAMTGSLLSGGHIIVFNISRMGLDKENFNLSLCKMLLNCETL